MSIPASILGRPPRASGLLAAAQQDEIVATAPARRATVELDDRNPYSPLKHLQIQDYNRYLGPKHIEIDNYNPYRRQRLPGRAR